MPLLQRGHLFSHAAGGLKGQCGLVRKKVTIVCGLHTIASERRAVAGIEHPAVVLYEPAREGEERGY